MGYSLYLFFNGNCEEAMKFYANVFNTKVEFIQRYKDAPEPHDHHAGDKIMHASMNIRGSYIMFSDAHGKDEVTQGNNFSISLDFKDNGEQENLFIKLSSGGKVTLPLQDTFWGSRFGMCTDKFGVNWMFSTEHK
jgi:PhnB protein